MTLSTSPGEKYFSFVPQKQKWNLLRVISFLFSKETQPFCSSWW